ncbi:MAG: 50S ribosomal protein L30e [Candidatus Diapherotrites archaeon]|uniref:Large ribosomal subunit protein eL30 n=1 Tax=Candidatus Iainarchaeum sp. TaxID=3101447 RepID=A0A8T4L940_9ARCH|nr:50S ribosomal protein L30e [Candidatus Diapherotrites archaeon]
MDMVEIQREIRRSVDTGKVAFGEKETEKNVLKGNGALIIVSDSATASTKEKAKHWSKIFSIPVFEYHGKGLELGSVCGKPFSVGTMLVLDSGKSRVLEVIAVPASAKKTKKTRE